MTLINGARVRIGGYTAADWGANKHVFDASAFIFNLTTGKMQGQVNESAYGNRSIYAGSSYFATFGGGHDIYGGVGNLGIASSYTYDVTRGQIGIAGDSGSADGDSGNHYSGHIGAAQAQIGSRQRDNGQRNGAWMIASGSFSCCPKLIQI